MLEVESGVLSHHDLGVVFVVEVDTRYPFRVTDKKQVGVLGEVVRLGIEI